MLVWVVTIGIARPYTQLKTLERNRIVLDFELKQGLHVHLKAPLIYTPPLSSPARPLGLSDPRPALEVIHQTSVEVVVQHSGNVESTTSCHLVAFPLQPPPEFLPLFHSGKTEVLKLNMFKVID